MKKTGLGVDGESYVARYLEGRGYEILSRNYFGRFGEIDIIAKQSPYLCFVEVKTRRCDSLVTGFEAVTVSKQKKIRKTAECYIAENEKAITDAALQPRFDCAEVSVSEDGLLCGVKYIENAF